MNDQTRDNIEVRLNKDGSVDEILIDHPYNGRCLFHLEQMDDHWYWMRAYGITQDLVVHIGAGVGKIQGRPILGEEAVKGKIYPGGLVYQDGKTYEMKGHEEIEAPVVWSNFEWEDGHHEDEHTPVENRTPEESRYAKVSELLEKFGVDQVLNDLMVVYGKGRRDPHDNTLVKEVQAARIKYAQADKEAWDKKLAAFQKGD